MGGKGNGVARKKEKKTDGFKGVVIWDAIKKKDLQKSVSHLFECVCFVLCWPVD